MTTKVHMNDVVRWLACAAGIVSLALFAAAGRPENAAAAESCGEAVIQDWEADGTVSSIYAPDCYGAALRELPEDARLYSSATSDILAARARAANDGNTNRSLQSAKALSTARAGSAGGSSSHATALTAAGAVAAAAVSVILVQRRRRSKRA
jgi:hypothetical protein